MVEWPNFRCMILICRELVRSLQETTKKSPESGIANTITRTAAPEPRARYLTYDWTRLDAC